MKQTDYNNSTTDPDFTQLQSINKKKQLFSNHLNDVINSLTNPRFLGSIHMRKANSDTDSLENLVESELQLKTTKALKSTLFNPVTKILIILAVVFNILWFLFATIL
jgi:hypothetical protein